MRKILSCTTINYFLSSPYQQSLIFWPTSLTMNKNLLYVGSNTGEIAILDARMQYHTVVQWSSWISDRINCLAIAPHNTSVHAGSGNLYGEIKQWDIRNTKTHTRLIKMNDFITTEIDHSAIRNIHITKDGKKLSATNQKYLLMWNLSDDQPKVLIKSDGNLDSLISNTLFMNEDETDMHLLVHNKDSIHMIISPNCSFDDLYQEFDSPEGTNQSDTDCTCCTTPHCSPKNINSKK